jgi:glutaredoxin
MEVGRHPKAERRSDCGEFRAQPGLSLVLMGILVATVNTRCGKGGVVSSLLGRADGELAPPAQVEQPDPSPGRGSGWLRPKKGEVIYYGASSGGRKDKRNRGRITYLDAKGIPVHVKSMAQVPHEYRNAVIGRSGALVEGGGYSEIDFAKLPPLRLNASPQVAAAPGDGAKAGAAGGATAVAGGGSKPMGEVARAEPGAAGVSVYGTAWCSVCKQTKAYLTQKGVAFRLRDIEEDSAALAEYMSYGDNKVPLVLIGNTPIRGFDPSAIDRALGLPAE